MRESIVIPSDAPKRIKDEGYVLLDISGQADEVIQNAIHSGHEFFQKPLSEKMSNRFPADLGYRPFAGEYSQSPDRPDQVESFSTSFRICTDLNRPSSECARHLVDAMLAVTDLFESVAVAVTSCLYQSLCSPSNDTFSDAFHLWSLLQMNYSRPATINTHLINDLHEDGCLITVSYVTAEGLELRVPSGEFKSVVTKRRQILVMPGEILYLLSGGYFHPTFHRVRTESSCKERFAVLFFGDINPDLCHPWRANDVNKEINIGERVRTNPTRFGLEEWKWK